MSWLKIYCFFLRSYFQTCQSSKHDTYTQIHVVHEQRGTNIAREVVFNTNLIIKQAKHV